MNYITKAIFVNEEVELHLLFAFLDFNNPSVIF